MEVEYKVGHCGHFGTMCMLVSITVLEIEHVGTFTDSLSLGDQTYTSQHS